MNTKIASLALAAATALSLTPKPAHAGDKEWAAVGGFLGGLIVASAINDNGHDYPSEYRPNVVVVSRPACREEGYWKEVTVRTWIPGGWIIERSRHGGECHRFVEGHYEFRSDRIWVAYDRYDRDYRSDHREREVGYGYGRRPRH